ncbi:MAG TPA: formate/nitrite transporter family protein [Herpetosiphonaceae bacterium]|jgi:formate/nitrite transporter|nr:formate/nitrite transporter family protein [Herpetosiphonaceae bacterium]
MPYVKPDVAVDTMIQAGEAKANLAIKDWLIRGFLSGALLGFATTLAFTATGQTGLPIVGALIFPAGFVMIVLLGLELVTGNFAILALPLLDGKIGWSKLLANWGWVFVGNLLGSLFYALLFSLTVTRDAPIAQQIVKAAQAKTVGYQALGWHGMEVLLVKAILCNWMVTLGVVMAFTSQSTIGKIAAMWLPILTFFAQGFEHSVVNMFVIPAGMLLGARVSFANWWLWNQIPVTLGNIAGGFIFTGLALYLTHRRAQPRVAVERTPATFVPESEPVVG